jgi:thiol-disulfide isomerase/thioredoxin
VSSGSPDELRSRLTSILNTGPTPVSADEAIRRAGDLRGHEGLGQPRPGWIRGAGTSGELTSRRRRLVVSVAFGVALIVLIGSLTLTVGLRGSPTNRARPASRRTAVSELPGPGDPIAPASLVREVTSVPASVFTSVGLPSEISNVPEVIESPLTTTGPPKPTLLYVWASYCPFCAAENWALVMALSRFGTFSYLRTTASSVTDFAPNTQTLSFYGAEYSSPYFRFEPYDLATNKPAPLNAKCNEEGYGCLQTLPSSDVAIWQNKDLADGSFPFVDFGSKLFQAGAGFSGQPLALAGLTRTQIAIDLHDPSSSVAQAEVGEANYFTAAICRMTGGRPSEVCSTPAVRKAEARER